MALSDLEIAAWFREAWEEESHTAAWRPALERLTVEQALWRPEGATRCIWDHLRHMSFWRELNLRDVAGEKRSKDEVARRNWGPIEDRTPEAWRSEIRRFEELNGRFIRAFEETPEEAKKLVYFIEHDAYHMGQVMLLRALQGLPPMDSAV